MDEIRICIHQNSFDILAVSETCLSDKIPNELVNIPGINVERIGRVMVVVFEYMSYILLGSY